MNAMQAVWLQNMRLKSVGTLLRWLSSATSSSYSTMKAETFTFSKGTSIFSCANVNFKGLDARLAIEAAKAATVDACAALGMGKAPSFLLAFSSAPAPLLKPMLEAVTHSAPPGTPLSGCSSLKFTCLGTKTPQGRNHITLAAAYLPGSKVQAFMSQEDSLPVIPDLPRALLKKEHQFIVLSALQSHLDLKGRLESLFGNGSCLAAAAGTLTTGIRRTAMVQPNLPPEMSFTVSPDSTSIPSSSASSVGGIALDNSALEEGQEETTGGSYPGFIKSVDADSFSMGPVSKSGNIDGSETVVAPPGGLDEATEDLVAAANQALELAMERRGQPVRGGRSSREASSGMVASSLPISLASLIGSSSADLNAIFSEKLATSQAPLVFHGTQLHSNGCVGVVLMPAEEDGAGSRLPPAVVATMARAMLGQDRFSVLDVQEDALRFFQPRHTAPGLFLENPKQLKTEAKSWIPTSGLNISTSQQTSTSQAWRQPHTPSQLNERMEAGSSDYDRSSSSSSSSSGQTSSSTNSDAAAFSAQSLKALPMFELGKDFVLLPGQVTQLRVFEKRYQLLMKHVLQRGGCFGFPIDKDLGITAVVQQYLLNEGEFYVVVEGGHRFSYRKGVRGCFVLPGTFGLSAVNANLFHDRRLDSPQEAAAVVALSQQLVTLVHEGVLTSQASSQVVSSAGMFAAALHMAGGTAEGAPAAAAMAAREARVGVQQEGRARAAVNTSRGLLGALDMEASIEAAKACMDLERSQALSLYLAACMPVDQETKRHWLMTTSTLERLREQVEKMQLPNLRMATSTEIMRQRRDHPLRDLVHVPWSDEENI
ncbi:hypothetical protein CEUSTIGMA_g10229.t1 [Chlamydomonas eustigma]|uniref:Lon N-terminal domain-containing protein n=1 Tax=Chlamydomonas eustigma TaxID=1157962 RepID=A0A250XID4_9CHLO|nr:hypothetical protein CEUSTIGMA_g10229.t1 [Chlamydomonas eustigma]|eukprot:GAX82803.1 hypothetical protein CEUSTIGMA_g10229.t1 [Chlamydomonas eustigma]